MKKIFLILIVIILGGCTGRPKSPETDQLMVSIQPLKYLVDNIVGDDFEVVVLVPPGTSPETYEPTPAQIKASEKADILFFTGLVDFERALLHRLPNKERFVDLSTGIDLIEGSCTAHNHGAHSHHHSHGVDPHIWTSPKALIQMAQTAYEAINALYPDSLAYAGNYLRLRDSLIKLDETIEGKIETSGKKSFMIFHPGLTYYARDYGLEQIALEQDGKEPSARQLQQVLGQAQDNGINKVFYQAEFPITVVEVAAAEIGAVVVEIDVLGYDLIDNLIEITDLIVSQ